MSPRSPRLHKVANAWRLAYIGWDFVGAFLAYTLLYTFRKSILEPARFGVPEMAWDNFYVYGSLLTAGMWVGAMGMVGLYLRPLRKSRLKELSRALQVWMPYSASAIFHLSSFWMILWTPTRATSRAPDSLPVPSWSGPSRERSCLGYLIRLPHQAQEVHLPHPPHRGASRSHPRHMDGLVRHAHVLGRESWRGGSTPRNTQTTRAVEQLADARGRDPTSRRSWSASMSRIAFSRYQGTSMTV